MYIFFLVGNNSIPSSPLLETNMPVDVNKSASYNVQSPIGNIMVENIDDNLDPASTYVKKKT